MSKRRPCWPAFFLYARSGPSSRQVVARISHRFIRPPDQHDLPMRQALRSGGNIFAILALSTANLRKLGNPRGIEPFLLFDSAQIGGLYVPHREIQPSGTV